MYLIHIFKIHTSVTLPHSNMRFLVNTHNYKVGKQNRFRTMTKNEIITVKTCISKNLDGFFYKEI